MYASLDLGTRLIAAVSAMAITAVAMALAIVPASPASPLLIGGLA